MVDHSSDEEEKQGLLKRATRESVFASSSNGEFANESSNRKKKYRDIFATGPEAAVAKAGYDIAWEEDNPEDQKEEIEVTLPALLDHDAWVQDDDQVEYDSRFIDRDGDTLHLRNGGHGTIDLTDAAHSSHGLSYNRDWSITHQNAPLAVIISLLGPRRTGGFPIALLPKDVTVTEPLDIAYHQSVVETMLNDLGVSDRKCNI